MTELPRILIVKHLPDSFRDEPRNVGVALWTPTAVAARFLGENPDERGEVLDADMPAFVSSPDAYKTWVRYWWREVGKGASLAAIREGGLSNYLVTDGGTLAEPIAPEKMLGEIETLYAQHVAASPRGERPRGAKGRATPAGSSRLALGRFTIVRAMPSAANAAGGPSKREMVKKTLDTLGNVGPGAIQEHIRTTYGIEIKKVVISTYKTQLKVKKAGLTGGTASNSTLSLGDVAVLQDLIHRLGEEPLLRLIDHMS